MQAFPQQDTHQPASILKVGLTTIEVTFSGAAPDLSREALLAYVKDAAGTVSGYYGQFPVDRAKVAIAVIPDRGGVLGGTTWGNRDGFPGVTRLRIGQHVSEGALRKDWILTHELVHMALPSLPDDQHWLEEGIATYVEPIARFQSGFLTEEQVWSGMVDGMPHGEPEKFDQGLDITHTWGRTYWGGALFCLIADIRIREQTRNAFGLRDGLIAIIHAHGSIKDGWPIERVLQVADKGTGTTVLHDLYKSWRTTPVEVDLNDQWGKLGIRNRGGAVVFDDAAPLAKIRTAILDSHVVTQNSVPAR
ncbi:MAG: hypothetical protein ABSA39_18070 [Edaphobacter sp.]